MPVTRLKQYLDDERVPYVVLSHSAAYTAQEVAAAAHIPGKDLAKTVIVKLDGELAMAVVPASERVSLRALAWGANVETIELATEEEFADRFPACELGAMPPFGQLWGMPVFVSESLAEDEHISFESGLHTEVISLSFDWYRRLVSPEILGFAKSSSIRYSGTATS